MHVVFPMKEGTDIREEEEEEERIPAPMSQLIQAKDHVHFTWLRRKPETLFVLTIFTILLSAIFCVNFARGGQPLHLTISSIIVVLSAVALLVVLIVDYKSSRDLCSLVSPFLFLMASTIWCTPALGYDAAETVPLKMGASSGLLTLVLLYLISAAPLMKWEFACALSVALPSIFLASYVFQLQSEGEKFGYEVAYAAVIALAVGVASAVLSWLGSNAEKELFAILGCSESALLGENLSFDDERIIMELKKENIDQITKMRLFISYIFHEIRVPFNAVVLGTGLMLAGDITDEQREILKMMDASSSSMIRILNDVLDMGKIESGKFHLEKQAFNLGELVGALIWAFKDTIDSKGLNFSLSVDKSSKDFLSAHELLGDKHRVHQVVSNYISNAVKFTPRGGKVKLRIQCNTSDSPEILVGLQQPLLAGSTCTCPNHANFVSVTISVEDSGIGISKDDQARLFEPYMQISASSLQGGGGTGLGLCFAKRIVELSGGTIGVFSEVGKGSIFLFTIPFEIVKHCKGISGRYKDSFEFLGASKHPVDLTRRSVIAKYACQIKVGRRPKVLVVEDNHINRMILKKLLTSLNMDCEAVEDGKLAVDLCRNGNIYDMIMVDKEMPVMDGHEAVKAMRTLGVKAIIVGLTGNALDSDRNEFLAAGVDDFFTKPLTRHQLVELLEAHGLLS